MKLFIYFIATMLFVSLPINAKNNIDSVNVLQVVNKDLVEVLDSIIDHEQQCDYYSSDMLFDIMIHDGKITIGSIGSRTKKSKSIIGGFFYKNHLFFVNEKFLDETLFKKTKQKMGYHFVGSKTEIDPKTGIMFIDSMDMQDDSYSYWTYLYENNRFVFLEKHTYCE